MQRKTSKFTKVIAGLFFALGATLILPKANAAFSPAAVSIIPPVQFPGEDFNVTGFRISLGYGKQREVYGLDFGVLGNITNQEFVGLAVSGGFNKTDGDTTILGLQLAGGANLNSNKTTIIGLQAALMANYNSAEARAIGLQLALVNHSQHTKVYGFQVGAYNLAQDVYGFQFGLINVANSLHGVQIGLVNFNATGLFSVSPLLNIGF